MNLFRIFRKKPEPPSPVAVREALKICIEGMEPAVSPEEFENLYNEILESEINFRRNAADIINKFERQRRHAGTTNT